MFGNVTTVSLSATEELISREHLETSFPWPRRLLLMQSQALAMFGNVTAVWW
jgi:hypothetical protein